MPLSDEESDVLKELIRAGEYLAQGDKTKCDETALAMRNLAKSNNIFWQQLPVRMERERDVSAYAATLRSQVLLEIEAEAGEG